ncbi:MAG: hypothetical protein KGO96_04910 [Elusimicrobia bacterium]|nr:hypothetical protein [Elusimicrobiota bacterium]MDE2236421.1 hypothetical protein [Elusimicrobiota bacterium]MDE2425231.1 hypothetical protein [Elusimicrobiota bacterium]
MSKNPSAAFRAALAFLIAFPLSCAPAAAEMLASVPDRIAPSLAAPPAVPPGAVPLDQTLTELGGALETSRTPGIPSIAAAAQLPPPQAGLTSSAEAGLAAPAAGPRAGAAPAAARHPLLQRLSAAVRAGAEAVFGPPRAAQRLPLVPAFARHIIAPQQRQQHRLRPGVELDLMPDPSSFAGAVKLDRFHFGVDHIVDDQKPVDLNVDPTNAQAVYEAVLQEIDAHPEKYGVGADDLQNSVFEFVPGDAQKKQAGSYHALFRQIKKGRRGSGDYYLQVAGGSLSLDIKIINGRPILMASEGQLFPGIGPDIMTPGFSDEQLQQKAAQRLRMPVTGPQDAAAGHAVQPEAASKETPPVLIARQITQIADQWRAVWIYQASDLNGLPVIVAVDIHTGEAFAWSAQGLRIASGAGASGLAEGRGRKTDTGNIVPLALSELDVYDASGQVIAVTDENGRFTVPQDARGPFTIRLDGKYSEVKDMDSGDGPLKATFEAKPGQTITALINPGGDDENMAAAVNGYEYYDKTVNWLSSTGGIANPRIKEKLRGGQRANRSDVQANAYYDPTTDSLNFARRAILRRKTKDGRVVTMIAENTDEPSIIEHESTHRAVQVIAQLRLPAPPEGQADPYEYVRWLIEPVMDSGVNEGIADIVSMLLRDDPVIGQGFWLNAKDPGKDFIRTGLNTTQYDPKNPDPHARGEAFMGFGWLLRLANEVGLDYAARLLVPTTIYGQPLSVPSAIKRVVLAAMTSEGLLPLGQLMQGLAARHGVTVSLPPSSPNANALK